MYAQVRFRDDNVKTVVSVSNIKHFTAKDIFDFDTTKWQQVYWRDEKQEGYFKAQVLRLFETREEAEQPKKRVPWPKPPVSDDSEASEASDASVASAASLAEVMKKAAKQRKSKKEAEAAFQEEQMDALFPRKGHSDPDWEAEATRLLHENDLLKAANEQLKTNNEKLNQRVEMLEKALCSRIFKTEDLWLSKENASRCSQQIQRKPSPQVRVSPQRADAISPAAVTLDQTSPTRPQSAAEAELPAVSQEYSDSSEMLEASKPFSQIGNEVFLGSGVWLKKAIYDHLMQRPKDGIFVREASVQIFSTAGLFNRSVTGAASNRTKTEAKPPLD